MRETPNLNYVEKLADNDINFYQKFIIVLKEEFPQEREAYEDNFTKKKYRNASEDVHKIKHKLNILGLHNSHSIAVKYEFELRNNAHTLSKEFTTILNNVEAYLKTI